VKTFLLASMALPLLFPPILYNNVYYIDGAICKDGKFPLPTNLGNHLGICIDTVETHFIQSELTITIYLKRIFDILTKKQTIKKDDMTIITIKTDIHSFNFTTVVDDENYNILVENGYTSIKKVFDLNKYI
jgi:predicted acylesterase/phospholipase RssA